MSRLTFSFFGSEEEARQFCIEYNKMFSWRKKKAIYTKWESTDDKEHKFIAWYQN